MPQTITQIPLRNLRAHPSNSNVMPDDRMAKLTEHIRNTGRYPPLIVRTMSDVGCGMADVTENTSDIRHSPSDICYQVLDGHHRWQVLQTLEHEHAACIVWEVDDEQALVLLSTLNRLEGHDEPHRRANMLLELRDRFGQSATDLARLLPDTAQDIHKLLALHDAPPPPAPPPPLSSMKRAVSFFLLPDEIDQLETTLARFDGPREQALMQLINQGETEDESAKYA